jgi:hypothetical protein
MTQGADGIGRREFLECTAGMAAGIWATAKEV